MVHNDREKCSCKSIAVGFSSVRYTSKFCMIIIGDRQLSCLMRKPTICIDENKDADQLCGNPNCHFFHAQAQSQKDPLTEAVNQFNKVQ